MDALALFRIAAATWIVTDQLASLNLTSSGAAEVTDLAGGITYSLSCIPPVGSDRPNTPNEVHKLAQRVPLSGYTLVKTQVLRFETDLPIPDPKWRYQFIFRKN